MTSTNQAGMTYAEKIHSHRQQMEWRRERYRRNVLIAIQTLGFAVCVSTYLGVSVAALGSAYVKSPSSKFVAVSSSDPERAR